MGIATAVVAQIDNQRIGIGDQRHRGAQGSLGIPHGVKIPQVDVADISRQGLHLADAGILRLDVVFQPALHVGRRRATVLPLGDRLHAIAHAEMPVPGRMPEVGGQRISHD